MKRCLFVFAATGLALSAVAAADVTDINGLNVRQRIFNDFPTSALATVNAYPASFTIREGIQPPQPGFANRHTGYFSTDGGTTARDFDYNDRFDLCVTMDLQTNGNGAEAGFQSDLFGFGFFGVLQGSGRVQAFGTAFPDWQSDPLPTVNGVFHLRAIHRPGTGTGTGPIGANTPSTMEYLYAIGAGPWVSSGPIPFANSEGGFPDINEPANPLFIGVGTQNNFGNGNGMTSSIVEFTNFRIDVPAPGAAALFGTGGLLALRRRR